MANKDSTAALAKRVATTAIVVAMVTVLCNLVMTVYYEPSKVAARNFDKMARAYYEDYFYDKFIESIDGNTTAAFEKYTETGFAPVLLRQLLLYDNGKFAAAEKYFDKDNYYCSGDGTMAVFKPVAPYGKTDYEMEVTLDCKNR